MGTADNAMVVAAMVTVTMEAVVAVVAREAAVAVITAVAKVIVTRVAAAAVVASRINPRTKCTVTITSTRTGFQPAAVVAATTTIIITIKSKRLNQTKSKVS